MAIGTGPGELCGSITINGTSNAVVAAHGIALAATATPGGEWDLVLDQKYWAGHGQLAVQCNMADVVPGAATLKMLVAGTPKDTDGTFSASVVLVATGAADTTANNVTVNVWRVGRVGT